MNKGTSILFSVLLLFMLLAGCAEQPEKQERMPETGTTQEAMPTEEESEPAELSYAETEILDWDSERIDNIKLAVQTLNGTQLAPNELFSFNGALGARTEEKGYKPAPIIVNQQKEEGCGGGVCQVSTTIYQAAKAAGLLIVERHDHQKEVQYAPLGEDAAVNYGSLDMQFRNSTDRVLRLDVSVGNGFVRASIKELG
ncbi:MAG: factor for cell wall maintenance or synthesis YoaR [Ruminococcaceae bacterium]|nr:factor for cell wall maintenance or synthesis YoaR [Oscillospiraceae bacterium]